VDKDLLRAALGEAGRSSDWWRQVGAVAVRDGVVLDVTHNEHRPTEYSPYVNGDPRNDFRRGVHLELSTAIHAEALLVARAARQGRSLHGADLYVSTFPCPGCARLIAEAGFRRCLFAGPYAVLDGEQVLRAAGVVLVWVDLTEQKLPGV
jgi:dCMP deaminase